MKTVKRGTYVGSYFLLFRVSFELMIKITWAFRDKIMITIILFGGFLVLERHLVWFAMSRLKPLFNLSVNFDFFGFLGFLGPK